MGHSSARIPHYLSIISAVSSICIEGFDLQAGAARGVAVAAMAETLDDHVVSSAVGNVRNDSPELIEPVE